MNKKEIIFWRNKYDEEEDLYDKKLEGRLRKKFQKNKLVTKPDLIEIVKWKFQSPSLLGRRKRILSFIDRNKESTIREFSKLTFRNRDDETRLRLLSSPNIKGVGNALASVILAFYNPKNYGILDIHAWRELFDKKAGEEPQDLFSNHEKAIEFFNKLRGISSKTGFSCRDIEKALFKKNLDNSNNQF